MKKLLNFKNVKAILLLLTISLGFSCSKSENFDFNGDETNRIFVNTGNYSVNNYNGYAFAINQTPIGPIGEVKASFPIKATQPVTADVKVEYKIDNSLIDSYNTTNKTSYVAIPEGLLTLSQTAFLIAQGQTTSNDVLEIAIPTAKLPSLTSNGYLIPFRITNATGATNTVVSSNQNTVYLVVKTNVTNVYNSTVAADMTTAGTLIASRTAWTATLDVPVTSGALLNLFDAKTTTNFILAPSKATKLIVNMGAVKSKVSGVRIHTSSTTYALNTANVFTSVDGVNWDSQGTVTLSIANAYQYVKFYSPINAAYIRLDVTGYRSATQIILTEFDVYTL